MFIYLFIYFVHYIAFPLREALSSKLYWRQGLRLISCLWCHFYILYFSTCDTWRNETIRVTNSKEKMSRRLWCGPSEIYLHWSCLLITLLDGISRFLLSLFILYSFSFEIISPLFMFILTMSLVKMLFVI